MPIIKHEQFIKAPVNICFDLARNVNIHTKTTSKTKEKVIGGVKEGLLKEIPSPGKEFTLVLNKD